MNARYLTADVFTDRRFGGNQLAVFPDAREIAPDLMPHIAREFNYSETTFVLPPDRPEPYGEGAHLHARRRVAVCRPSHRRNRARPREHRRHYAHGRTRLGSSSRKALVPIPVTIRATNGRPDVRAAVGGQAARDRAAAAVAARRSPRCSPCRKMTCCDGDMSAEAVSCGTPFLFVPLRDRAAVGRARDQARSLGAALSART